MPLIVTLQDSDPKSSEPDHISDTVPSRLPTPSASDASHDLQDVLKILLDPAVSEDMTAKTSISRTKRAAPVGTGNALPKISIKPNMNLIDAPKSKDETSIALKKATHKIEVKGPLTWLTKYLITQVNAWYYLNRYNCVWYEVGVTNHCAWFWAYKSIQLPIKWTLQAVFFPIILAQTLTYYTFFSPVVVPLQSIKSIMWAVRLVIINWSGWMWLAKGFGKGSIITAKIICDLIDRMWRYVMNLQ
ncbi:hypothetical protein QAD02_016531 [Eretmocerus hayati]|uniref:Uncharacterized protein n=1 Tax=Eretmocerus hayati TaxID=131215 RepID=A0ACC2PBS1_9HYME|nr:hypothetical protein QAD02_016531 [Eretmocerus hayati]